MRRERESMKKTKRTLTKAKKELWAIVSKYVRLRDCIITTGTKFEGLCVSCGVRKNLENADAGHFITRAFKPLCYDERNIHFQCKRCNGPLKGNFVGYIGGLKKRYGDGFPNLLVDIYEAKRNGLNQWKVFEIEALIEDYTRKLEGLK